MKKKYIFLFAISWIITQVVFSQDLQKQKLLVSEKRKNIAAKYQYISTDSYGEITLILKRNGFYDYSLKTFNQNKFSKGKWKFLNGNLLLNSSIEKD